jgi:hypothetical protein
MKESKASGRPRPSAGAAIEDPRFSRLHSDPRFQRMPKNKTKVAIDSRFSHMFSDKNFHGPLGVDKRGRVKKKKETQLLERYYKIGNDGKEEEEDEHAEKFNDQETVNEVAETVVKTQSEKGTRGKKNARRQKNTSWKEEEQENLTRNRKKKGVRSETNVKEIESKRDPEGDESLEEDLDREGGSEEGNEEEDGAVSLGRKERAGDRALVEAAEDSSEDGGLSDAVVDSDLEETSSSSSSSSSEGESDKEDDEAAGEEAAEKVPTTNEETQRLALMNMDWEHIKAMDLLVLLRSFLPKGGRVDSVTVYPSEFGLKQMEEEEVGAA